MRSHEQERNYLQKISQVQDAILQKSIVGEFEAWQAYMATFQLL